MAALPSLTRPSSPLSALIISALASDPRSTPPSRAICRYCCCCRRRCRCRCRCFVFFEENNARLAAQTRSGYTVRRIDTATNQRGRPTTTTTADFKTTRQQQQHQEQRQPQRRRNSSSIASQRTPDHVQQVRMVPEYQNVTVGVAPQPEYLEWWALPLL